MKHPYEMIPDEDQALKRILERMEYSLVAFYLFTGVPVTMFSPAFEIVWELNRTAKVCSTHASYVDPCSGCRSILIDALKRSAVEGGKTTFICNTGLMNLCYAIKFQGIVRGYLIAGPFGMGKDRERTFMELYDHLAAEKIDVPQLMTMMRNLNVYTPEQIEGLGQIFKDILTAAYIGEEETVPADRGEDDWEEIGLADFVYRGRSNVIFNAVRFIREHYRTITSLSEVADYVHVTRSYLSSLFKKEMGVSIVDFMNDIRLTAAERELKNSSQDITNIALSVGYREPSYFSRLFKKKYGMNPREYRNAQDAD